MKNQDRLFRIISLKTSLRSKRFRLVSEQKKTEERDFRFGRTRNEIRSKTWKWEEGEVSFLSSPPPPRSFTYAIFRAVFDSRQDFSAGDGCRVVGDGWIIKNLKKSGNQKKKQR